MLEITIPETEFYDSEKNEFFTIKEQKLKLEHSLVSISRWEAKWCKHFIGNRNKTNEEVIDYIRCMTLTQNVNPLIYEHLPKEAIEAINAYIEAPMTATTFRGGDNGNPYKIVTSEEIYYMMIALGIPSEYQKWHINRLLTLIRVCNIRGSNNKKMGINDIYKQNRDLNAARRKALKSSG